MTEAKFYQSIESGGLYNLLIEDPAGAWLISYERPAAPFFVSWDLLCSNYQRAQTPRQFEEYANMAGSTIAQKRRLAFISALLADERCITDKAIRRGKIKEASAANGVTEKSLYRLYYRYLATRILTAKKKRDSKARPDFDWAIRTFYFSSKRMSLRSAYETMLLAKYVDVNGNLTADYPSWRCFERYYYARGYNRDPAKIIAREGKSKYQRDFRPISGAVMDWKAAVGSYQMDATQADIFLVSRTDRNTIVGRPYIYLAVDTASHLIAGVHIGFEAGQQSVISCLANAAEDKTAFCAKYGVEISADQWPSRGVPYEIITDQGREFTGEGMGVFCMRYGTELHILPPFRPDQKGIVEKTFDLIQSRYKPLLRGKGVIEPDAQERWATDYSKQAVLNLDEFTAVVINCIIAINTGQILPTGETPVQLWTRLPDNLLQVDSDEVYYMGLTQSDAKVARKGISCNGFWYTPNPQCHLRIGDRCRVSFDPEHIDTVYIMLNGQHYPCRLSPSCKAYAGIGIAESRLLKEMIGQKKRDNSERELMVNLKLRSAIAEIVENRKEEKA